MVPTRNERDNIGPLVDRLSAILPIGSSEVIFVDDSSDDTPEVIASVSEGAPLPVLMLHREPNERVGGLGGAVVAGMRLAEGRIVVVMDGDLQHPPETIPDLVRPIETGEADLVVASRYRDNGVAAGLANRSRVGVSHAATRLTKSAFPRRLQDVSDPMSGFFAVRTSAVWTSTVSSRWDSRSSWRRWPGAEDEGRGGRIHLRSRAMQGRARHPCGRACDSPPIWPGSGSAPCSPHGRSGRPGSPPSVPPDWSSTPSPSGSSSSTRTCPTWPRPSCPPRCRPPGTSSGWNCSSSPGARAGASGVATGGSACSTTR